MDHRLKKLSYSSRLTLHSCPRKYQLYKLGAQIDEEESVHCAFGHAVGTGIQAIAQGKSLTQAIFDTFLAWDIDLLTELPPKKKYQKKTIWHAVHAVSLFNTIKDLTILKQYNLAYVQVEGLDGTTIEIPAVELSFRITFPDGYTYVGFVDIVLEHKETKELLVLELKTTGISNVQESQYKNSSQAIGYSIILDSIAKHGSDYKVLYLVYKSPAMEYEHFLFTKVYTQRALWIQQLLLDIEFIERYEQIGIYPLHGESCFGFGKDCEYYGICTLDTSRLISPTPPIPDTTYTIDVTLTDLIDSQLNRQEILI